VNLKEAKDVLLRTHVKALERGKRASGKVMESMPGVGKSQATFQYAAELARTLDEPVGLVVFMMTTITSPDVRGFMLPLKPQPGEPLQTIFSVPPWYPSIENSYVVEPDGTWHRPGTWTEALPEVGILFLDEWGQADEDVKKPAAELILNGNVGTTFLQTGWRVLAAQNRMSDRSGTVREMMFVVNRRCLMPIDSSLPTFLEHVDTLDPEDRPHYLTVSYARAHPDTVFRSTVPDGTDPFCTPRSLCLMDRDLQDLADEEDIAHGKLPMTAIAREICAGWVGNATAGQFFTHLRYADELPDMEDIEQRPMEAKLPPGRDAQMVCAYMMVHHFREDNARNILRYIMRMAPEMQILSVGIIQRDERRLKNLVPLREYQTWLMANKDRLIASQS
jgi:hypothetical protein